MKKINLTQGKHAIVDDDDYPCLIKLKWCVAKDGNTFYAVSRIKQKTIRMHRYILNLKKGEGPHVDHINHNGLDNRKSNLRTCTSRENQLNQKRKCSGATFNKAARKWKAQIKTNGKRVYLGLYKKREDAEMIYDIARHMIA